MIDELEIVKQIVENLSDAGIYALVAFIGYKLVYAAMVYGLLAYVVLKVAMMIKDVVTSPDKDRRIAEIQRASETERHKHKMEVENLKHMYKMLKEAKQHKSEGSDGD